jgi:hypothetical protein
MDGKKKNTPVVADPAGTPKPSGPVKVLRAEDVSASIFAREIEIRGQNQTFYSVSFSRSYRDSKGAWQYSKSFNLEDLGKVVTVAQQADEHIRSLSA